MDEIDVVIPDHEFAVFVGPSGSGKTTFLRLVAGLEIPTAGHLFIGDRDVTTLHPRERGIAMVFQDYALYPHMTVGQNMSFALENLRFPKAEIEARVLQAAKLLQIEALLAAKATAAVGRSAPASRARARDRPQAGGLPLRRAPLQPRREAARRDATGALRAACRAPDDGRLRHTRPGRGAHARRSDLCHERRPGPADRIGLRALRHARERVRRVVHRDAADQPARRRASRTAMAASRSRSTASACPCPPEQLATVGSWTNRDVRIGIRPEHLTLGDLPAEVPTLTASVRLVEHLGSELLVHLDIAGSHARGAGARSDGRAGRGDEAGGGQRPGDASLRRRGRSASDHRSDDGLSHAAHTYRGERHRVASWSAPEPRHGDTRPRPAPDARRRSGWCRAAPRTAGARSR